MRDTLDYEFSELPLLIGNGIEAGHVNGTAEINFSDDGEWSVGAIYLDGYKAGKPAQLEVDTRSEIFLNILDSLERGSRKDSVEAKVWAKLEDMGVRAHSDFREHNTLHRTYQGV